MNCKLGWYTAAAMAAAIQVGTATLAYAQPQAAPGGPGLSSANNQSAAPGENPGDEPSVSVDLPVLFVTNVEILQTTDDPKIDVVSVTGLVSSDGWSFPQLVPTYAGKPFDGVLDLQFIATPPAQSQPATGFVAVNAVFPLDPEAGLKGVRVRGAENAISVLQTPGSGHIAVQVNDCKECLGKRLAPPGQAAVPGVVRQEDLPKALRVVRASDGIRGVDQDPDRLTLITDENGTIVQAFWE